MISAASRRAVRARAARDASHGSNHREQLSRPGIYNSCRGALCAARHRSAKPLKPRAAFQLLRTTPVAARALQFRAPSLLQLPRCAAADTTWPKEKKTRRRDSAAGRTKVRPQRKKKKKNSTPTRAAGAGSSTCKGVTRTVTARRRAATG